MLIKSIIKSRILQHLVFWMFSILVITFSLKVSATPSKIDVIYALIFHITLWAACYLNLYLLVPKWLKSGIYAFYVFMIMLTILFFSWFFQYLFNSLIDFVLPNYFFISYFEFWDYALFLVVYLLITTLLKLARSWFTVSEIEAQRNAMELNLLKTQMNPHFLFNTLNTIYGLLIKEQSKVSGLILNLSDLLRYSLYSSEKECVDAQKEIDFIENYVALQSLRFENGVVLNIKGYFESFELTPLILLPLVENCFKHAGKNADGEFFINIDITKENRYLHLSIKNTCKTVDSNTKGIGLLNTKKRLDMVLKDNYKLEYNLDDGIYYLELKMKLWKAKK